MDRRAFLRTASAALLAVPLAFAVGGVAGAEPGPLPGVTVRPRPDWAQGLAGGPMEQERPEDVRFLIVHHTASPNGYAADDVPALLRGFHSFHTGPEKRWPDVAYNFFVDRYGMVWEGRAGSLAGPVKPDATGGSQGFAQICCFIGDHTTEAPTAEARRSMVTLLAALAERYGINPAPGATTSFVSRGSNKWPAGTSVTSSTIAGHRDMSLTTCPGDAAYPLVRQSFPTDVAALLAARATPRPTTAPPSQRSTAAPAVDSTASSSSGTSTAPPITAAADAAASGGGIDASTAALAAVGAVAAAAAAGVVQHVRHRAAHTNSANGDTSEGASDASPR
jgi:hypothetical protein